MSSFAASAGDGGSEFSEEQKARYEALSTSALDALLKNLKLTDWTLDYKRDDLKLTTYYRHPAGSSVRCFKAECVMPYSPQQIMDFLSDINSRLQWDSNIQSIVLTKVRPTDAQGRSVSIMRCATKTVGPIAGRDFYDAVINTVLENGSLVNCGAGIDDTRAFPEQKGFVRGYNYPGSGWYLEPIPEGTRITYFIQTELRGWFLPIVINSTVGGSYATFFKDLIAAMAAKNVPVSTASDPSR